MEDLFKILIVDDVTIKNHEGEEWDLFQEVKSSPSILQIQEYTYLFRGIIRSIWHDVSKTIEISCDTSDDSYLTLLNQIKESMLIEEMITFSIKN